MFLTDQTPSAGSHQSVLCFGQSSKSTHRNLENTFELLRQTFVRSQQFTGVFDYQIKRAQIPSYK